MAVFRINRVSTVPTKEQMLSTLLFRENELELMQERISSSSTELHKLIVSGLFSGAGLELIVGRYADLQAQWQELEDRRIVLNEQIESIEADDHPTL